MLKALGLLVPLAGGALYFGGAFDAGYAREVDRSPEQVAVALQDLDIRRQPGSPGTDPSRAGGIAPTFRTERTPDGISFVVMSGDQVATRMTARLEPLDGGARTRVTATVQRGDAPDERVSPAFQSTGLTMGLFTSALSDELNELVRPPALSEEECAEIGRRLLGDRPVEGLAAIARVHQVAGEMERNGCSTRGGGEFRHVESRMGPASASPPSSGGGWGQTAGPASTAPGGGRPRN